MSPKPITDNTLFYGDNLPILREYIADESIGLVYLDPPFNSNRSYNVLFRDETGEAAEAQITAFDDTWHWTQSAEQTYHELVTQAPNNVGAMIGALRQFIGTNQMMAYLVMMAVRLVELHRVLKPTGSLYLHCDPTASHYLKLVLDTVFGAENYRNEIIWQRTSSKGNVQRKFGAVHDVILAYAKSLGKETWNQLYRPLNPEYVVGMYRYVEEDTGRRYMLDNITAPMSRASTGQIYEWRGKRPPPTRCWIYAQGKMEELERQGHIVYSKSGYPRYKRYLDENRGEKIPDIWDDIGIAAGNESLGYPTQKPLALLERIIQASSNAGDLVLDPFCGCGTAVAAAQKLGRRWIGIDITHLAITLQKNRLRDMFPGIQFKVIGEPQDIASAHQLGQENPYQFQWWALSLVQAKPLGGEVGQKTGKKGSDKGIDGVINFVEVGGKPKRVIVQVKSGNVKSGDVRDLHGTVDQEGTAIGVLITLEPPTAPMLTEAVSAGYYHAPGWNRDYPRIQILTIEELLHGKKVDMPPGYGTFKQAEKAQQQAGQHELGL